MCQEDTNYVEQKVIHENLLQTTIKKPSITIIVNGYCTGTQELSEILLEIATEKIEKRCF